MDKYSREILTLIKENFERVVGKRSFQTGSEARSYYLEKLEDNLYKAMGEKALKAYGEGSGNEISSGKMNALRSSSALTYNLFGNGDAKLSEKDNLSDRPGAGVYSVEFEKKYHTLKQSVSGSPANLDAFLYCRDTREAIACEMKMLEWLFNKPGKLKSSYLVPENYIGCGDTFVSAAKELIDYACPNDKDEYPCKMTSYDAFQMFKHTVACYSACMGEEPRSIRKLTLVNCVWTLSAADRLSQKDCERYVNAEICEHNEFNEFKRIMNPIRKVFCDIGVDFDICFYKFNDFLSLFDKSEDELNYLRRYTFD